MVKDVRAAVDFMRCRSTLRHNATLCSQHGYATSNAAIDRIPYVDLDRTHSNRLNLSSTAQLCIGILYCLAAAQRFTFTGPGIYLAGFALGGTVALHAAALDSENYIAGVASFA
jgi:hypothetical protein